jgi:LmbE family N-acetylglucosaminyl deacetylase
MGNSDPVLGRGPIRTDVRERLGSTEAPKIETRTDPEKFWRDWADQRANAYKGWYEKKLADVTDVMKANDQLLSASRKQVDDFAAQLIRAKRANIKMCIIIIVLAIANLVNIFT